MLSLILASSLGCAPLTLPPPTLAVGEEVVYAGELQEQSTRTERPYQRRWSVEVRLFVLRVDANATDVAVMTQVRPLEDAAISASAAIVTGSDPSKNQALSAVSLLLVRLDARGHLVQLRPDARPPIVLNSKTPTQSLAPIPLTGPIDTELGMFVPWPKEAPTVGDNWTSLEVGRPNLRWSVKQVGVRDGAQLAEVVNEQTSEHFAKPTGTTTSWRRSESLWVSPVDGLPRNLTRTVEHREGVPIVERRTLSLTMTTPPTAHRGEAYLATRKEIEFALSFQQDFANRSPQLLERIESHTSRYRETPYRAAIETVARSANALVRP